MFTFALLLVAVAAMSAAILVDELTKNSTATWCTLVAVSTAFSAIIVAVQEKKKG